MKKSRSNNYFLPNQMFTMWSKKISNFPGSTKILFFSACNEMFSQNKESIDLSIFRPFEQNVSKVFTLILVEKVAQKSCWTSNKLKKVVGQKNYCCNSLIKNHKIQC